MIVNVVSSAVFGAKNSALQKRKNVSNPIQTPANVSFEGLSAVASYNKASLDYINFNGNSKDAFSYENFTKARIRSGILDGEDLDRNINENNLLGSGKNSSVYKFSDPNLAKWAIKVDKQPNKNFDGNHDFKEVEDKFEGFNRGQEIAKAGDRYHILKRLDGVAHSIDNWPLYIVAKAQITEEDAVNFADNLHKIANFDDVTYDDYANKLAMIDKQGYKMDSINPNNLLIDYDNEEIHIIDFTKKDVPAQQNSSRDLSSALLDFSFFAVVHDKLPEEKQAQFREDGKTVFEKCEEAAKANGISDDEDKYLGYVRFVDEVLGWYIVKKGEKGYEDRYKDMKKLIK